jgi:hypothetical protein
MSVFARILTHQYTPSYVPNPGSDDAYIAALLQVCESLSDDPEVAGNNFVQTAIDRLAVLLPQPTYKQIVEHIASRLSTLNEKVRRGEF